MEGDQKSRKESIVVYHNAKMDTVYYDGSLAVEGDECEVKLDNGKMVISYEDGCGFTLYEGKETSEGHFMLECRQNGGKASLHCFPKRKILEGFWIENGEKGFWRIFLR